nr:MAG TPA: hypothetical protein [Caudoviricetes sp.]
MVIHAVDVFHVKQWCGRALHAASMLCYANVSFNSEVSK